LYLGQRPMPARALIEAGVRVAVATDFNPGSAPSWDLPLALLLACTLPRMTPAEALKGATIHAARAAGAAAEVGSLEPGKAADFAVIDAPDVNHWLYHFRPNACVETVIGGVTPWLGAGPRGGAGSLQVMQADLPWTGTRFEPGVRISVDPDGRIAAVGPLALPATLRLGRCALLPGFVNVHSHGFQPRLRGRGERFPRGAGSFWSWREAMYDVVASLDRDSARRAYVRAFAEMRDAGITTVGEFHYLHHAGEELDYAFDAVVLEAARIAGIRLVLLNAFYATGGIGRPLAGVQRRFRSAGLAGYWAQMDRLEAGRDPRLQTLGVVAHSIRAVPLEDIAALHAEAVRRGLRFHMHVEEQVAEIDECVAAYGRRPMATILDALAIDGNL